MPNVYTRRQSVELTATFTDANGQPLDPATVELDVRDPSGQTTTYGYPPAGTIIRISTGSYQAVIQAQLLGTYHYAWTGTSGTLSPAAEGSFLVAATGSGL